MALAAAARRYLLYGASATVSLAGSSYLLNRTKVHADSEAGDSQKLKKTDPLISHESMACSISGWKDAKIARFDYAALANKDDRYCSMTFHCMMMNHGTNWTYVMLSEGLRSWENSVFLFKALIPTVISVLDTLLAKYVIRLGDPRTTLYPSSKLKSEIPSEEIDECIKTSFRYVDHGIVNQARDMIFSSPSKARGAMPLGVALAGSTGMFVFYDDASNILKVANAGDARAVLGRPAVREDGTPYVQVHVLSSEHTSENPDERVRMLLDGDERLEEELRKYIGRDVTRAFGLAMCKWSREVQERMRDEYFGEPPLGELWQSAPAAVNSTTEVDIVDRRSYLTAEPEVTTFHVQPDDFLIIANKGLWNSLTNEEATGLVGAWFMHKAQTWTESILDHDSTSDAHIIERHTLPVDLKAESGDTTVWYKRWEIPKRFILVDHNVAVHLARNALGGANRALMESLLKVPHPFSANCRDELAVAVFFFD